jgi:hypothetical protein
MNDMRGIRAVPVGLGGTGGLYTQGSDKARGTRLVSPWALLGMSLRDGRSRFGPVVHRGNNLARLGVQPPAIDGMPVEQHGR